MILTVTSRKENFTSFTLCRFPWLPNTSKTYCRISKDKEKWENLTHTSHDHYLGTSCFEFFCSVGLFLESLLTRGMDTLLSDSGPCGLPFRGIETLWSFQFSVVFVVIVYLCWDLGSRETQNVLSFIIVVVKSVCTGSNFKFQVCHSADFLLS